MNEEIKTHTNTLLKNKTIYDTSVQQIYVATTRTNKQTCTNVTVVYFKCRKKEGKKERKKNVQKGKINIFGVAPKVSDQSQP